MRQVIERFLKHLKAERNATATLESYRYDLYKFEGDLEKRLGTRFLPEDVCPSIFGIISILQLIPTASPLPSQSSHVP